MSFVSCVAGILPAIRGRDALDTFHPAIRLISIVFGPILGPILGKLCQLTVVVTLTVYLRRWAIYIFVAVIILYAWAAWYNVWGCDLYYPRLLYWLDYISLYPKGFVLIKIT